MRCTRRRDYGRCRNRATRVVINLRSGTAYLLCHNHAMNAASALLDHHVPFRVIRRDVRPVAFRFAVLHYAVRWLSAGWWWPRV